MVTNCNRKSFGSRPKNSKSCSDEWHRWRFFRTHFAESFRMSKSSWMMDPTHSREMPSCSAIDLAKIRQSCKISSWVWSIISRVVTILGCPRWGASQVENSPRLNWATQFCRWHTMVHAPLLFLSEWLEFPSAPCLAGKKKKNLMTARVSMLLKSSASPDMLPFSLSNKKTLAIQHMTRPLFTMTLSIVLQHREVGRAKDLSAPPRKSLAISKYCLSSIPLTR